MFWEEGLENSWGASIKRGWEGIEMAQGETNEERQNRAVRVKESSWLLRVVELVSGSWTGSVAPSSHELPALPLLDNLSHPPLTTGPMLPLFCLLSLQDISSAYPCDCLEVSF